MTIFYKELDKKLLKYLRFINKSKSGAEFFEIINIAILV